MTEAIPGAGEGGAHGAEDEATILGVVLEATAAIGDLRGGGDGGEEGVHGVLRFEGWIQVGPPVDRGDPPMGTDPLCTSEGVHHIG